MDITSATESALLEILSAPLITLILANVSLVYSDILSTAAHACQIPFVPLLISTETVFLAQLDTLFGHLTYALA
jgi:hypothetical protein